MSRWYPWPPQHRPAIVERFEHADGRRDELGRRPERQVEHDAARWRYGVVVIPACTRATGSGGSTIVTRWPVAEDGQQPAGRTMIDSKEDDTTMTVPVFQIVVDAEDPHRLNRFWAAAVDYEIEDHHTQIQDIVAAGYATADDTIEIDGRLAWKTAAASRDPDGRGPRCCSSRCRNARRRRTASTSTSRSARTAATPRSSG